MKREEWMMSISIKSKVESPVDFIRKERAFFEKQKQELDAERGLIETRLYLINSFIQSLDMILSKVSKTKS